MLVSVAALRTGALPKALNILGIVIGMAGTLMLVPAFAENGGAVFGLGFIVWFFWAGIVMMRSRQTVAQSHFSRPAVVVQS